MTSMAEDARPWRCFWAVPMPDELTNRLAAFVGQLRAEPSIEAAWRFTEPDGWHLTLAFLGAIPPAAVEPMIMRVAGALDGTGRGSASGGGLGGFPGQGRARVMWYGIADEQRCLADLASRVRQAAPVPSDEPFRPHVTLARSRDRRGASLPSVGEDTPRGRIPIDGVVLFRSHLGRGPARYQALAQLPIGKTAVLAAR